MTVFAGADDIDTCGGTSLPVVEDGTVSILCLECGPVSTHTLEVFSTIG